MTQSLERKLTELAWRDPIFKRLLEDNPKEALKQLGITVPAPIDGNTSDEAIDAASRRIYDILFTEEGVGGFLTPDDSLTWALRDIRISNRKSATE